MRALLRRLAEAALSHPWALVCGACAPALLLGLAALSVPVDLSFTGIMNRADPEVDRYFRTARRLELGGALLLLLEGPEEALSEASARVERALERDPAVLDVVADAAASDWMRTNLPWLVERPVFDAWLRLATHPLDRPNAEWLAARLDELADEEVSARHPGSRVLQVRTRQDPLDVDIGGGQFFALERRVHEALDDSPVRASFSGLPALAAQDQARTLGFIRRLTPLSLLGVLALFHLLERRWLFLAAAVVPLLLAMAATLGAVGLLLGKLTVMETFFGVTVFGLGIDFAIHLMARQREERVESRPFADALRRTLPGAGRGIVAGAATTAGAFLLVAAAPDPVALHLGLSGGLGLLLCLVLMMVLLPALWVLLERRRSVGHPPHPARGPLPLPLLAGLARHATAHPRLHLAVSALVCFVALLGTPRFRTETDLQQVFNRRVPALEASRRIQETIGLNGAPWVVGVDTLEESRRLSEEFAAHPEFVRVESLGRLLPGDVEQRASLLDEHAALIEERLRQASGLAALASAQGRGDLERYRAALAALAGARAAGAPSLDTLPASLRRRLRAPDGSLLVLAWARESPLDATVARTQRLAAQAVHPDATGLGSLLEAIMLGDRSWTWPLFWSILAFVAAVLIIDLRAPRLVVLALVPVILGVSVTFGVLCWAGVRFNVMTTLVVPLILGLGVDDGIHVVHRIREGIDASLDRATAAVGRAIVLTTATTGCSFAVLLLTDHPGLESMGLVMVLGLPLCLLASVTTLPALGTFLLPRSPLAGFRE